MDVANKHVYARQHNAYIFQYALALFLWFVHYYAGGASQVFAGVFRWWNCRGIILYMAGYRSKNSRCWCIGGSSCTGWRAGSNEAQAQGDDFIYTAAATAVGGGDVQLPYWLPFPWDCLAGTPGWLVGGAGFRLLLQAQTASYHVLSMKAF